MVLVASRKILKPYAIGIAEELRREYDRRSKSTSPYIDLAEVTAINPDIIIVPHNSATEYDEDGLIFQTDPNRLKVGDTVVMGRDPSGQPIVIGLANAEGGVTTTEVDSLKASVTVLENTTITGDFIPTTGGTVTGDIINVPGVMITLPDAPVFPSDVVNKAYVDALVASIIGSLIPVTPTVTIDVTDSTPCYAALPGDQVILVDCSGGPVSICLPAGHSSGKFYEIKDMSGDAATNNITIGSADGDLVELALTFVMNTDYQAVTVISDGTDWFIF